jgi:hypothetical protein
VGSGSPLDRAPTEAAAPGGPSPSGDALAGRWLSALEQLVARSAHEINNALNGAVVNVEVVRIRARPGADAGAAASFAESAAGELERAAALVGALVALGRGARADAAHADVGEVLRQVAALVAPVLAHRHVTLALDAEQGRAATIAPLSAVRLGVAGALLAAGDALAEWPSTAHSTLTMTHLAAEPAGSDPADEPVRLLRCTLRLRPEPELRLVGETTGGAASGFLPLAPPAAEDLAALASAGIRVQDEGSAVVLRFPLDPIDPGVA